MEMGKKVPHIGQMIKEKMEQQGKTTVWLSQQLGCHRTNVYKIYDKHSIDTGMLLRISKALDYDFFQFYSELVENDCNV